MDKELTKQNYNMTENMKRLFFLLLSAFLFGAVVSVGQISNPNARAPKTTKSAKPQTTPKQEQKQKVQRSSNSSKINLTVSCNVTVGSLYIDGNYYGKPNGSYKVNSGWHKISIDAKGYKHYEDNIYVNSSNNYFTFHLKSDQNYNVTFRCNVQNARLYIDNHYMGNASGRYNLKEGSYYLRIESPGYIVQTAVINIPSSTSFNYNLIPH